MIDPKTLDEISRRLKEALPEGVGSLPEEMRSSLRALISSALAKTNLVTREEFDVQSTVLARTRAKVETLETAVRDLEARLLQRDQGRSNADNVDHRP